MLAFLCPPGAKGGWCPVPGGTSLPPFSLWAGPAHLLQLGRQRRAGLPGMHMAEHSPLPLPLPAHVTAKLHSLSWKEPPGSSKLKAKGEVSVAKPSQHTASWACAPATEDPEWRGKPHFYRGEKRQRPTQ